jgi:hypothetical protein
MNCIKTSRFLKTLFASAAIIVFMGAMEACSKKSTSSKTKLSNEPVVVSKPAPVEEKDGMQIKRDAAGNYVIQLIVVNLEPVKLMKPIKEGYIVWMTNESNVTTNIGTIAGANTWTDKKDRVKFEATSAVKPVKVFISAETDLNAQKPGTQIVWSTGSF